MSQVISCFLSMNKSIETIVLQKYLDISQNQKMKEIDEGH